MFSAADDNNNKATVEAAKPLETAESSSTAQTTETATMKLKNLGRGGVETEVNFYDPTMVSYCVE